MNFNILGTKVHVVLVFFGALCVLMLFGCIGVISWGAWKMNQHDEAVADLKNDNKKSQNETEKLNKKVENLNEKSQKETQKLNSQIESVDEKSQNKTEKLLQIIKLLLKSPISPIDENCDSKECLLCQFGWIFFSGSCYFFSDPYLTWNESRLFCQNKSADLVVIDNLQEQEFIYNNMNSYHWLGLWKVGSNWVWVDGRNDTLGFWGSYYGYDSTDESGSYSVYNYGYYSSYPRSTDSYAYMDRSGNLTASWATVPDQNPYPYYGLCEKEAFKVSLN